MARTLEACRDAIIADLDEFIAILEHYMRRSCPGGHAKVGLQHLPADQNRTSACV
jgi:hypothetical protein